MISVWHDHTSTTKLHTSPSSPLSSPRICDQTTCRRHDCVDRHFSTCFLSPYLFFPQTKRPLAAIFMGSHLREGFHRGSGRRGTTKVPRHQVLALRCLLARDAI